jgi:plasmid stability protein
MVTTLRLDDDLVAELERASSRSGCSFEEEVNRLLRSALGTESADRQPRPYRLKPASMGGPRPGIDLDKALRLSDALDDEAYREKLRGKE